MTVIKIVRNVTLAGVAGFVCGKGYKVAKAHPETVLPIVKVSAACGVGGALLGWAISAYRNLPTHIYTLSLGANFAVTSAVFLSVRHGIMAALDSPESSSLPTTSVTIQKGSMESVWSTTEHAHYVSSATSGGVAGSLASVVSRHGLKSIFLTGSGGLLCGLCGQFLYNRVETWRRKKAIEIHFPELTEQKESRWNFELLQERFLAFWHQNSKTVKWNIEIALVEDAIREEKERIAELDKELLKHGVEVKGEELSVGSRAESLSDAFVEDELIGQDSRTEDTSSAVPN